MRIISGTLKGRSLISPYGNAIRPTSDKVRGAVFSSLESYLGKIEGFVDCFSGSGAMAVEAYSRGITDIYCFDRNKDSCRLIKNNLSRVGATGKINFYPYSIQKGLELLREKNIKVDVFFMDPPYKEIYQVYDLIEIIRNYDLLSPAGLIVIEHDKSDIIQSNNFFRIIKEKTYGNTVISYIELKK